MIHSESRDKLELDLGIHARDGQFFAFKLKICVCFCLFGSILYVREILVRNEWNGAGNTVYETRRVGITRRLTGKWKLGDEMKAEISKGLGSWVTLVFLRTSCPFHMFSSSSSTPSPSGPRAFLRLLQRYCHTADVKSYRYSIRAEDWLHVHFILSSQSHWWKRFERETGTVAVAKPSSAVPISRYLSPWQIVCTLCFLLILL